MRALRFLPLVLLAAAVFAPLAAAEDFRVAVDPAQAEAKPGAIVNVTLLVTGAPSRSVTLEVMAKAPSGNATVTLSQSKVALRPNQTVKVAATVFVARNATPGDSIVVGFGARETLPNGSNQSSTTRMTIRVAPSPSATALSAAPTAARPVASPAPATPSVAAAPSPASPSVASPPPPARAEAASAEPPRSSAGLLVAGGAAAAGGLTLGVVAVRKRWGLALVAPLYTRLARNRMLDQPTRQRLADLVTAEPGVTFGEAQRRLGIGAGSLTHHARMLEESGVIFSSPDGQTRRLFAVGGGRVAPVPPLCERAMAELQRGGPTTLSHLAMALGVSRQALHYHVKRLASQGRIVARSDGRELQLAAASP